MYKYESRFNLLIDSTLDYFILYVPFTLVVVFLLNRLFYLLFNYEISKFLRSFAFWLILLELLIQNNIEFFTFVGFRALSTTLSEDFNEKVFNTLMIIFLFIVIFCTFSSYSIYYHR